MIAIYESYKANLLTAPHWVNNIISGIIVGIVALPLAMAFAMASGAKPEQGIYTSIIAGGLATLFGGSRLQITGPTGAFIVILAGITAQYGIEGLQIATVMAGLMLTTMGLFKLGTLIKFIPNPVIVGFTSGIAVIIWVGQWKDFFGLELEKYSHFHEKLYHLVLTLPQFHWATTILAIISLVILVVVPRISSLKHVPGPMIALIVATLLQSIFHFEGVATIGSAFGGIPQELPHFAIPNVTLAKIIELTGPAFTITMLGAIESLLSAMVADGMAGTRHDSNQELIGQGIANAVVPFFGGFAATGAIARTATNIRNGATSPLSGIVHCLTLLLIIVLAAPLAAYIPLCALSAILFLVAWNMSEAKHFVNLIKRAPRSDVSILLLTFVLTVFTDLVIAVNVGVIISALLFMQRMSRVVEFEHDSKEELKTILASKGLDQLPHDVMVYSVNGPLFFGVAEKFQRAIEQINNKPRVLILRLHQVTFIDMTGILSLEEMIKDLHCHGVNVWVTEVNRRVEKKLTKAGIDHLVGREYFAPRLEDAFSKIFPSKL
jgi:SulP family sulfate permease